MLFHSECYSTIVNQEFRKRMPAALSCSISSSPWTASSILWS